MKVLEFGDQGPATLFLHGFPGVRSKQNRDLAEKAASRGRRAFVPLYAGLGQAEGDFSFTRCQHQVQMFASELLSRFGSLDIVGHSWGGYLGLGLAAQHQARIGRLVLMSPLLYFFTLDLAQQAFALTARENAALSLGVTDALAREFHRLGTTELADDFARAVSPETRVSIFQARTDDTTPVSYAQNLVQQFKVRPSFELVETDHSFLLGREAALGRVLTALEP